jgi:hypothetical protein
MTSNGKETVQFRLPSSVGAAHRAGSASRPIVSRPIRAIRGPNIGASPQFVFLRAIRVSHPAGRNLAPPADVNLPDMFCHFCDGAFVGGNFVKFSLNLLVRAHRNTHQS